MQQVTKAKKLDANGKKLKKKVNRDVAKVLNKGGTNRYLMSINPYLLALADPFNVHGAKIPDMVCYPSSTFCVIDRRVATVNAQGVAYVVYGLYQKNASIAKGSLVPIAYIGASLDKTKDLRMTSKNKIKEVTGSETSDGNVEKTSIFHLLKSTNKLKRAKAFFDLLELPGALDADSYCVGMINGADANTGDLFKTSGVGPPSPMFLQDWTLNVPDVPSLYEKVRLVSAGATVNYTGTLSTAKGVSTVAFAPRDSHIRENASNSVPTLLSDIQNLPGARIVPNNDLKGATVFYHPQDDISLAYTDEQTAIDLIDNDSPAIPDQAMEGELYLIVTGATVGDTVQFTACLNYEGIPLTNNFNLVQTSPSISDPIALSQAMNVVQNIPNAIGSTAEAQGILTGRETIKNTGGFTSSSISMDKSKSERSMIAAPKEPMFERILGSLGNIAEKGANALVDKLPSLLGAL